MGNSQSDNLSRRSKQHCRPKDAFPRIEKLVTDTTPGNKSKSLSRKPTKISSNVASSCKSNTHISQINPSKRPAPQPPQIITQHAQQHTAAPKELSEEGSSFIPRITLKTSKADEKIAMIMTAQAPFPILIAEEHVGNSEIDELQLTNETARPILLVTDSWRRANRELMPADAPSPLSKDSSSDSIFTDPGTSDRISASDSDDKLSVFRLIDSSVSQIQLCKTASRDIMLAGQSTLKENRNRRHAADDATSNSKNKLPRRITSFKDEFSFVEMPQKLDSKFYELFEGQYLLNWITSGLSKHLKTKILNMDLTAIGTAFCSHLVSAGILIIHSEKIDVTSYFDNSFNMEHTYYWMPKDISAILASETSEESICLLEKIRNLVEENAKLHKDLSELHIVLKSRCPKIECKGVQTDIELDVLISKTVDASLPIPKNEENHDDCAFEKSSDISVKSTANIANISPILSRKIHSFPDLLNISNRSLKAFNRRSFTWESILISGTLDEYVKLSVTDKKNVENMKSDKKDNEFHIDNKIIESLNQACKMIEVSIPPRLPIVISPLHSNRLMKVDCSMFCSSPMIGSSPSLISEIITVQSPPPLSPPLMPSMVRGLLPSSAPLLPGLITDPSPMPGMTRLPPPPLMPGMTRLPPPPPMPGMTRLPPPPPMPGMLINTLPSTPPMRPGMVPDTSLPRISKMATVPPAPPTPQMTSQPLPPPTLMSGIMVGPSPPLSSYGPAALPPPPVGGWYPPSRANMRKPPVNPDHPMKPLYWTRIVAPIFPEIASSVSSSSDSPVKNSLWLEIEEEPNINLKEFAELFSREVNDRKPATKAITTRSLKMEPAKILNSKRSKMVGILEKSLHVDFTEVENAVYTLDTSTVSLEALQQIYEVRPTPKELEDITIHEKEQPDQPLDSPELFLKKLSNIQFFTERIACIMFQTEFADAISSVSSKLTNLYSICEFMLKSSSLKCTMAIILTLGNYMNGGNMIRGQADGFNLEILGKLKDVKSKAAGVTLLHYVVKTKLLQENSINFKGPLPLPVPEPADIEAASTVRFEDVAKELEVLEKRVGDCTRKCEIVEKDDLENAGPFKVKMGAFLIRAHKELANETYAFQKTRVKFKSTMQFYQYIPKGFTLDTAEPKDFFMPWLSFCKDFKDIWQKEQQILKKIEDIREKYKTQRNIETTKKKEGGLKARLQKLKDRR